MAQMFYLLTQLGLNGAFVAQAAQLDVVNQDPSGGLFFQLGLMVSQPNLSKRLLWLRNRLLEAYGAFVGEVYKLPSVVHQMKAKDNSI